MAEKEYKMLTIRIPKNSDLGKRLKQLAFRLGLTQPETLSRAIAALNAETNPTPEGWTRKMAAMEKKINDLEHFREHLSRHGIDVTP